jgi:hypothetical protein
VRIPIINKALYCLLWGAVSPMLLAGELQFALASYSVSENGSTLQITVARSGTVGSAAGVTVKSIEGTATAGNDFKAVSTALTWTGGDSDPKTVNISITDDPTTEGDETFTLELQNPTGDTVGAIGSTTITITDYEEGTLQFAQTSFTADESDGTATITINRVNGTNGAVAITLKTADDTAKSGSDYDALDLTVSFADGVSSASVPLTVLDDDLAELSESLTLSLSAISGGAILGADKTATLTITDSDSDFTPSLDVIELQSPTITRPPLVDLKKTSVMDAESTYLEIINSIPVLEIGEVSAEQPTSGVMEILLGTDKFYFYPVAVRRNDPGSKPLVLIESDHSAHFITSQDITVDVQPALGGLSTFQDALTEVELPELTVTENGNITVQVDQGPAPFERDENGELVINNSFYDRWHFRPLGVATISDATAESTRLIAHPLFPDETMIAVTFKDGSDYRQQILTTAPVNAQEALTRINARVDVRSVVHRDYGVIVLTSLLDTFAGIQGATEYTLLADYQIRRVEHPESTALGFSTIPDVNGDGLVDFKMVYANGEEQYFLLMSYE